MFRALARQSGFTVLAALTLALGIGANVTIFSALKAVVLNPLPFPDPDRLVAVYDVGRRRRAGWSACASRIII